MKRGYGKKLLALGLCAAMAVSFPACGKKEGGKGQQQDGQSSQSQGGENSQGGQQAGQERPEFIYVAKFSDMDPSQNLDRIEIFGGYLYTVEYEYDSQTGSGSSRLKKYPIDGDTMGKGELALNTGDSRNVDNFTLDEAGNIYLLLSEYPLMPEGDVPESFWETYYQQKKQYLVKYDPQGSVVYDADITEALQGDENNTWVQGMAADEEGNLCLIHGTMFRFFDGTGKKKGETQSGASWIQSVGKGKGGKVYVTYYDNASGKKILAQLDLAAGKMGNTYKDFPGDQISVVDENTLLTTDNASAYLYHLEDQTKEKLFDWLDSDINGQYIRGLDMLQDGRVIAFISDWEDNSAYMACLTKTPSSEVAEKETLTLGSLYDDSRVRKFVVDFNKKSEKYRIRMVTYLDYDNWTETSYTDGIAAMNSAIISDNCPDIISLGGIDVASLAKKGVFEDLGAYLDKSAALSREDYFENMLDCMTYDGKLVSIPYSFSLQTLVGKTADVGPDMGWSMRDVIDFAKAHPNVSLMEDVTREYMLQQMLYLNKGEFMDAGSGKCNFDSTEFKELLEFVSTFPSAEGYQYDSTPEPVRIAAGKQLLLTAYIGTFDEIQLIRAEFGNEPITYKGFPDNNGGTGCIMNVSMTYAISSKSAHKDAAWEFLEGMLTLEPENNIFNSGFSTRKSVYERQRAAATDVKYVMDPSTGQPMLDDEGNPIEENTKGTVGFGGEDGVEWTYDFHTTTEEEAAVVDMLLKNARLLGENVDEQILSIIQEEAAPFFAGQKSVDEVVNIIQSRISLYIMENS